MDNLSLNIWGRTTLLALLAVSVFAARNQVELAGARFDFGLVIPNSSYEHRVWIKATGDDTVTVGDIKTGCGCLSAVAGLGPIAPGDSLPILFYWQTRGSVGPQTASAFIYTEPGTRPLEVQLSGKVVTPRDSAASLDWVPAKVEFSAKGRRNTGRQAQVFTLINKLPNDLALAVVEAGSGLDLNLPDTVRAGQNVTGRVGLAEGYRDTAFETSITIELTGNNEAKYRVSVPVVSGDFSFRPKFTTTKQ